jgi:folate-dependent phosphoribosylglycinamide formyltransferase PurN
VGLPNPAACLQGDVNLPGEALDLLMLGNDNPTTWIIYNHLIQRFGLFPILIEDPVARSVLFRNRRRKLGLLSALSQVLFIRTIRVLLNHHDEPRIEAICQRSNMERSRPVTSAIGNIVSVNSDDCRERLRELKPKIILINGTRIIGKKTLDSSDAVFINTHHGITPQYRGAHGAYWALFNSDLENCGVTVHLVDEGIDTGNIIAQGRIVPEPADSFVTYPYLLTERALPLLVQAIEDINQNALKTMPTEGSSAVWYHPGFFQYLIGWFRGVR